MPVPYTRGVHVLRRGSRTPDRKVRQDKEDRTGPIPILVRLDCTHDTFFAVRPKPGDLVFCRSCDDYRFVSPTGRAGSNKLGGQAGGGAAA
jgi:hypothetical protein